MSLETLTDYLLQQGLSKYYLPERVLVLPTMPMTQSGKIQKFKLRQIVAEPASADPKTSFH